MSSRSGGGPPDRVTNEASSEQGDSTTRVITRQPSRSAAERLRRMRSRRHIEPATTPLMFERANWQFAPRRDAGQREVGMSGPTINFPSTVQEDSVANVRITLTEFRVGMTFSSYGSMRTRALMPP
jgi:hypothetical protein